MAGRIPQRSGQPASPTDYVMRMKRPTMVSNDPTSDLDIDPADTVGADAHDRQWIDQREIRRRPSHWHKPPPPRNLRYVLTLAGKSLLVVGLLLSGFVVYQLWGTGIETARAQNGLEADFEAAANEIAETSTAAVAHSTSPSTTSPSRVERAAPPTSAPAPPTSAPVPPTSAPAPPTSAPVPPTSAPAPPSPAPIQRFMIPEVARGEVLAKLEIPRMGKTGDSALYVMPGVSYDDLKDGPGHFPGTPLPGQLGNASIAGHRTTYGQPFRNIDQLEPGDEVVVTVTTGQRFVYRVVSQQVVGPDDLWVVSTQAPDIALLTLTSCDPVGSAEFRIAVHAVLDAEQSDPVGPPTLYELPDGAAVPVAGPTPPPSTTPAAPTTIAATADEELGEAASASTTVAAPTAADDVVSPAPVGEPLAPIETAAFSEGWFDDTRAVPHIAFWAAALVLIALLGYQVAKQTRRDLLGIASGAVPFLVALYFLYQNISRLLPPGI